MRVVSKKLFREAAELYQSEADAILRTYNILDKAVFTNSSEMKKSFSTLDRFKSVKDWWVIDIAGNTLRLITFIDFKHGCLFAKHIVSHAEYDKLCKKYSRGL